jgi:hypothetical protein
MEKFSSVQVRAVPNSASESQMFSAIMIAWQQVFGTKPTLNQVANTWAQIAIETGRGKYILNNNVGNINWTQGNPHDYYMTTDDRSVNGNPADREKFRVPRRSYGSLVDGVVDYLTLLKHRPVVMQALMQNGSPEQFSHALADVKYYDPYVRDDYVDKKGNKQKGYTSHLQSLYGEFVNKYQGGQIAYDPSVGTASEEQSTAPDSPTGSVDEILERYLQMVSSASSQTNKKMFRKLLPNNDVVIQIDAKDYTNAIEFARVLCSALETELLATAYPHTDGQRVEIECSIPGPATECNQAVIQLSTAIADAFKTATRKIGGIDVSLQYVVNKKSSYQPISLKTADTNYRKFLLKFV